VTGTTVVVWLVVGVTAPLSLLATWKIVPFLVAGLVAPGLARLVFFVGVDRVGVARAASVLGTAPLFAVIMAVLTLGERPSALLLLGAACIVGGGTLLSRRGRAETGWRRRDLGFPLLAALGFAMLDVVSRAGLRDYPHPLIAAGAATLTSLAVMWGIAGRRGLGGLRLERAGLAFLVLSGLAEGVAHLTMWRALAVGDVSIVSPLVNAHPIFAVSLAALFLRDLERVTWQVALAAAVIITGIVLVVRSVTG
jgi:DME family drug/metabolite transporter